MKAFEKWLDKEIRPNQVDPKKLPFTAAFEKAINNVRKEAWRAALEWVAKRGMHHYGNDFLTDMNELSTEIRIELGMLDEHGKVIK